MISSRTLGVALLAVGIGPGHSDVREAVDSVFQETFSDSVSEAGPLGELVVSLVEREMHLRETQYRPARPVKGLGVAALAGIRTGYCLASPELVVRWKRYGPIEKVLARADLASNDDARAVMTPAEWAPIARQDASEPWLQLALCLAAFDIVTSQKLTTAAVRSGGTVLEEIVAAGRAIPDTSGKYRLLDDLDVPEVQRGVPWVDAWERPILFKSDGRVFEVLSRGTDGVMGPLCESDASHPPEDDPDCDIVYVAGGGGRVPPGISGW